jgi:hypothetical protein
MKTKFGVLTLLIALLILLRTPITGDSKTHFHTPEEISFYQTHFMPPLDSGEYFALPQTCKGCHGFDSLGQANIDLNGMDVNLYDDWETSMMAFSAIDPLWRAKVSHEILVNPSHANELQTLCTSCHAPLGHYDAFYKGQTHYTLADLANDSLGQSGVSCHSCHAITDSSILGTLFTGSIPYDTNRIVYGPFPGPMIGPMQLYVGLTPAYGPHMSDAKSCAPCHTLISSTVDLSGVPNGNTFVEQATYHEFLNSSFPGQSTCQTCHMPKIEDPIKIANGYTAIPGRTPFNLHTFQGANSFMVELIKNNKSSLGVTAPDANFDSTLKAINTMLREQTLELTTHHDTTLNDTIYFSLQLLNKAGHKFPTGYPSRRAVVQFIALKTNGDTLFASGLFDQNFEVQNIASPFLPHYEMINDGAQTQIYEMVMGDVNGDRTTVLERGASHLKDNRIPPLGFTTTHSVYDTCEIAGNALVDPNFNKIAGVEGSGADIIKYNVPLQGYYGTVSVHAKVYYQTVPPGWLNEMQSYSSAEIDTFLNMYAAADKNPVLIAADSIINIPVTVGLTELNAENVRISPNPTYDGRVTIDGISIDTQISIYNSAGQQVNIVIQKKNNKASIELPSTKGIYYIILTSDRKKQLKKIIRL